MSQSKHLPAAFVMSVFLHASASADVTTYDDLGAFVAAGDDLTVERFDAARWIAGGALSQPVTNLGVSWTAAEALQAVNALFVSPTQAISSIDTSEVADALQAELPAGVTAVGGWVANAGAGNDVSLTAFDAAGDVIGSIVAPLAPLAFGEFVFVGITSSDPIASVEFLSLRARPDDDFALDDFYFGTASDAECFLVLGSGPGNVVYQGDGHLFQTQVQPIEASFGVLMTDIAEIEVPVIAGGSLPGHVFGVGGSFSGFGLTQRGNWVLAAQLLMWNPEVFPGQPEQYTAGTMISVSPTGGLRTLVYGTPLGGMEMSPELRLDPEGNLVLAFPFTMEGL